MVGSVHTGEHAFGAPDGVLSLGNPPLPFLPQCPMVLLDKAQHELGGFI